jgi:hypothetical protein
MESMNAADDFELPAGITYLNCSNMCPQLKSVTAAGLDAVRIKAAAWAAQQGSTIVWCTSRIATVPFYRTLGYAECAEPHSLPQ